MLKVGCHGSLPTYSTDKVSYGEAKGGCHLGTPSKLLALLESHDEEAGYVKQW